MCKHKYTIIYEYVITANISTIIFAHNPCLTSIWGCEKFSLSDQQNCNEWWLLPFLTEYGWAFLNIQSILNVANQKSSFNFSNYLLKKKLTEKFYRFHWKMRGGFGIGVTSQCSAALLNLYICLPLSLLPHVQWEADEQTTKTLYGIRFFIIFHRMHQKFFVNLFE